MDPKRIIEEGYDRLGARYRDWTTSQGPGIREWFLDEVLQRLPAGAEVLELGCGPGTVFSWLRPGGRFMLSLGASDSEGEVQEDWLGVPMFFAGFEPDMNERSLLAAGFEIELSESRTEVQKGEGEETFHWVIARKPSRR